MVKVKLLWLSGLICLAPLVWANTEKTIFKAPPAVNLPTQPPTLDSLGLAVLTPDAGTLRTRVRAAFPDDALPLGPATWLLLYNLTTAQRYELRVSWAATVSVCLVVMVVSCTDASQATYEFHIGYV